MQPPMILRCLLSWFVICQMFGDHSLVEAAEYKSEVGISFEFPDDWTAITELDREKLSPAVQAYLKENPIDLRRIQVTVIRLNDSDIQENFNVVMTPREVPVSASSIEKRSGSRWPLRPFERAVTNDDDRAAGAARRVSPSADERW